MEIKTIQAVNAYSELKTLKLSTIDDETMFKIWNVIKKVRPIYEEYQKDREDAKTSITDEKFGEMQERLRAARVREEKVKNGEYVLTEDDYKDVSELNEYFGAFTKKLDKCVKELDETKVEIDAEKIPAENLLKALKANDKDFEFMEQFDWLLC